MSSPLHTDPITSSYDVPPVSRAFSLLRYISAGNRCRNMTRAATTLGINRTTLLRLLHTLEREGMIEQDIEGGGYILSYGLLELASSMLSSRDVVRLARPMLSRMAAETDLSAHLGVLSRTEVIVLVRETPEAQLVSNIREGSRLPAHATVMGRIIMAYMPRADLHRLLSDKHLAAITPHTPVTFEALEMQLDIDRVEGLAWSVANFEAGIGSCAGVVLNHSNRPVAAISLSGPQAAFERASPRRQMIADAVRATSQQLSALLGARI